MLEVVAKEYEDNIREKGFGCSKVILNHEPDMDKLEILLKDENISIKPWDSKDVPEWWHVYNAIKHNRCEEAKEFNSSKRYFQYANQKNVLYALAALFSLEMYGYRRISQKNREQLFVPTIKSLLSIKNSHWKDVNMGDSGIVIGDSLYMLQL